MAQYDGAREVNELLTKSVRERYDRVELDPVQREVIYRGEDARELKEDLMPVERYNATAARLEIMSGIDITRKSGRAEGRIVLNLQTGVLMADIVSDILPEGKRLELYLVKKTK